MKIFIAIYPNERGELPHYFSEIEKNFLVLHPSFDFGTEEGLQILNAINPVKLPPNKKHSSWDNALEGDCYAISLCDLVIYDSDNSPGTQFLAWAKMLGKPVICVSENLKSVEPYFSGSVRFVCKPSDIFNQIALVKNTVPDKDVSLLANTWMDLRQKFGWYTYARHKSREGVAILCYNSETKKILIRKEHCPCHVENEGELITTSITGSIEKGNDPKQTALIELKEEAGLELKSVEELKFLGKVFPSKFMDYVQYLFAVDIKDYQLLEPTGDGTKGEENAFVEEYDPKGFLEISENTIGNCIYRLRVKYGVDLLENTPS